MSGVRAGVGKCVTFAIVIGVIGLTLAGCGHGKRGAPTQVVARVDGHEITVSEVDAVLAQVPGVAPSSISAVRRQAIHALVEQQLELDEAKAQKLDQTPGILLQLELARRQVLANAYLRGVAQGVSEPSDDVVRQYYDSHPDLFSARKIYRLREMDARGDAALEAKIQGEVNAGQRIDTLASALKAQGVPVQITAQSMPAERIPLDLLPKLAQLSQDQSLVARDHGIVRVIEVLDAQSQPVDEAHALPVIREALLNQARKAAIAQAIERLTANAKIQYLDSAGSAPATAPASHAVNHPASTPKTAIAQGAAGLQ